MGAHPSSCPVFNVAFSGKDVGLALSLSLSFSLFKAIKFPSGNVKTAIYPETDVSFILIALVGDFPAIVKSLVLAVCCEDSPLPSKSAELVFSYNLNKNRKLFLSFIAKQQTIFHL